MNRFNVSGIRAVALLAVALGAGIAIGMGWSLRHSAWSVAAIAPTTATATSSAAAGTRERHVLYWHDPMKPEVRFDRPGKSPFMDMPLVPVYADGASAEGKDAPAVEISAGSQQRLGIRLGRVERLALAPEVRGVGVVAYDETAQALVQPRADGYVTRMMVRSALEQVRRGQVLAEVDVPAWREALGEYLAALTVAPSEPAVTSAGVRESATLVSALHSRLAVLGVPAVEILQAERSRSLPPHFSLRAPIDGVVAELGMREGAAFAQATVLARINQVDRVWVDVQLPEVQARAIRSGENVSIDASVHSGLSLTGRVLRVLPQLDLTTRTATVRVVVSRVGGQLRPGMYANARFRGRASAPQLWVPSEAIITTGERSVVIVARGDGGFDVAEVVVGIEAKGKTAVLSGLSAGQSVVLSGQFLIDSEANLKSAINRLTAGGAAP